jgi:hypothetical protein
LSGNETALPSILITCVGRCQITSMFGSCNTEHNFCFHSLPLVPSLLPTKLGILCNCLLLKSVELRYIHLD